MRRVIVNVLPNNIASSRRSFYCIDVIATGGGIVVQRENLTLMRQHGVCIYLAVDPATALQRLLAQEAAAEVEIFTKRVEKEVGDAG